MATSPLRRVRLGQALDAQFDQLANERKVSPSELLRLAMRRELAAAAASSMPKTATKPAPTGAGLDFKKVTLRVPVYVLEAARERALLKGMKVSRWMVALVQSNVTADPVLSERELHELEESSRQLAAIGRNINQVARAINAAPHEVDRLKADQLEYLGASISRAKAGMFNIIRSSRNAWRVDGL